jgi:SAM-dependent methyltransferase
VASYFPRNGFHAAIDIACGTGDSLLPLAKYAKNICGIDVSDDMLNYARAKGLQVEWCDVLSVAEDKKFDLLTTCMAFHWFDQKGAIEKYKAISQPEALWLIYHFAFSGHSSSTSFNDWFLQRYLSRYPSPPRHPMDGARLHNDEDVVLVASGNGKFDVEFDKPCLVGYLTTQSNIEQAVNGGQSYEYEDVEAYLLSELQDISIDGTFKYAYAYELFRYAGG